MRFNPLWIAVLALFIFSSTFFLFPLLVVGGFVLFGLFFGGASLGNVFGKLRPLWGSISSSRSRANLALLHATEAVLAEKYGVQLDGYSSDKGFFVSGTDDASAVYEAASQAISRLKGGEKALATCVWCGVSKLATGIAIFICAVAICSGSGLNSLTSMFVGLLAAYFIAPYVSPYLQSLLLSGLNVSGLQIQGTASVSRTVSALGGRLHTFENGVETVVSSHDAIEAEIVIE